MEYEANNAYELYGAVGNQFPSAQCSAKNKQAYAAGLPVHLYEKLSRDLIRPSI